MNYSTAVVLFNDSMRREKGIDHEGNTSSQLTGLGGVAVFKGIDYLPMSQSEGVDAPRYKAAELLREWADALCQNSQ